MNKTPKKQRGAEHYRRLRDLERLYSTGAWSDQELAERLNVSRSQIFRDRQELDEAGIVVSPVEHGRYRMDQLRAQRELTLSREEALALYLPARRAARQTYSAQPAVIAALEKLAQVLAQPMTARLVESAQTVLQQAANPERAKVVETVTRGWIEQIAVQLTYRGLAARDPRRIEMQIYLIEPAVWGDGVYLIGHSDLVKGRIAALKLDRVEAAQLTTARFDLPPDLDQGALLADAWGIWLGRDQPERVVLKFKPGAVSRRVQETIWHPTEQRDPQPEGLIWSAEISEIQEMVPWIRGWGADVEVVEPTELRDELSAEAARLAALYGITQPNSPTRAYYAHSKDGEDKSRWQRLTDHLHNTADLAAGFGRDAGVSDLARAAGLMHDIGKYSDKFQRRLAGAKLRVDHSTAGAQELAHLFGSGPQKHMAEFLAHCVAGHHTGLLDQGSATDLDSDGTLSARLRTKVEAYDAYRTEIDSAKLELPQRLSIRPIKGHGGSHLFGFSTAFMTRMVFSALVDADFQDTETYMNGPRPRGAHDSVGVLQEKLNRSLKRFDNPQNDIDRRRTETLRACQEKANEKPGIFTLTVPTGGGKTLASLAFALNHAAHNGLRRVIYVIPFTSIIEQNAAVFKDSLGAANVLEHHSSFDWEQHRQVEDPDDETGSVFTKLKLAAENWDIPIVATTNVQFFESLFANRTSRCRKVHNLAKSVIVLDEAQMLPREHLYPAIYALWELATNYGATVVLCTATQPGLQRFFPQGTQIAELAPDPEGLFESFRRVKVVHRGTLSDADLATELHTHTQALCIVNTRKHARGLFESLEADGRFHLSTLMCPAHRQTTLREIRGRLMDGNACRVVSTQVMEAGIDVDFPVGYRALAGLDSIIQAAGRVNREGKRPQSELHVFEPDSEFVRRMPRFIEQGAAVARSILRDFEQDPVSMKAIAAYFDQVYALQDRSAFDARDILGCFDGRGGFAFKTAAERFKIIDDNLAAVIVPWDEDAQALIEELKYTPFPASTLRKLQRYTVNIYEREYEALNSQGAIIMVADVYAVLGNLSDYSPVTGLLIPESGLGDALFL